MPTKDIKYLGRNFDDFKQGLIEFAKVYYPTTYNDFNETSPGMMFLEMAAYVGDVLNYYIDSQFKENLVLHAQERRNLLDIASAFGYKPRLSIPSIVDLDVYQLLPATGTGESVAPDTTYGLVIDSGMQVRSSADSIEFTVQDSIDFTRNSYLSPTDISVYSIDQTTGAPNYYLAKKTVKAISATRQTATFTVGTAEKFKKFLISADNLVAVESIVDSDGNIWYEVPYLAQDTIFEKVANTQFNDPDASVYSNETPYLLKLKKVYRRFITRVKENGIEIQFGSGVSTTPDEELLATPENLGLVLPTGIEDIDASIDPASPLFTRSYGIAPSNTTLTVTYLVGGGVSSNVPSNTITEITNVIIQSQNLPNTTPILNQQIINSLAVNNAIAASGGKSGESIEEIRQNTLAQFTAQNRSVTREDYIVRAYAMPPAYGSVAKVFITPDEQNNISTTEVGDTVSNPLAMNMYVLGYDNNKNIALVNRAVKENLKVYLDSYRMLTDSINIRDAYVINIGVSFDIITLPSFNANEVLLRCVDAMKNYFDIDKWQINQPIMVSDIFNELLKIEGVQTVTNVYIDNKNDSYSGYSDIIYDIKGATRNGIVYPSLDPSIFEVKYPNVDIKGRIATY
jgi:hypothetical protein